MLCEACQNMGDRSWIYYTCRHGVVQSCPDCGPRCRDCQREPEEA